METYDVCISMLELDQLGPVGMNLWELQFGSTGSIRMFVEW